MDSARDPLVYHRLKQKVKVPIGSIRKELKLVVSIDRNLVHLPQGGGHSLLYKRLQAEHQSDKREENIFRKTGSIDSRWAFPYYCRSVDSTFLCDLAQYVKPSLKRRNNFGRLQSSRRSKKSTSITKHLSSGRRIKKSQNQSFFIKRRTFGVDCNPLKSWKIVHRDTSVKNFGDLSDFREHPKKYHPLSIKMEHAMLNGDLKEYSTIVKKETEFDLSAKMVVASNNNKVKVADEMLHSHMLPEVDEGSSVAMDKLPVKVEKEDGVVNSQRYITEHNSPDSSPKEQGFTEDQTVPQLPVVEHNQLSASSPDKLVQGISPTVFDGSQECDDLEKAPSLSKVEIDKYENSPCFSKSGTENFEGAPLLTKSGHEHFEDSSCLSESGIGDAAEEPPRLSISRTDNVGEHSCISKPEADDEYGSAPYLSKSGLEDFEYNSHTGGIKINGHCYLEEIPPDRDLKQVKSAEPSLGVSIGEQVDEEIKALLDDVDMTRSLARETGNDSENKADKAEEFVSESISLKEMEKKQEPFENSGSKLSAEVEYSKEEGDLDKEQESAMSEASRKTFTSGTELYTSAEYNIDKTLRNTERNAIIEHNINSTRKTEQNVSIAHDVGESFIVNRSDTPSEVKKKENRLVTEIEPMDVDSKNQDPSEETSDCRTTENRKFSDETDARAFLEASLVRSVIDQVRQLSGSDDDDDDQTNIAMTDPLPNGEKVMQHETQKGHSESIEDSQRKEQQTVETGDGGTYSNEGTETSPEEQFGRKELKQQQAQSLDGTEMTSEPMDSKLSEGSPGKENNVGSSENTVTKNERSLSVIVSNTRSLSQDGHQDSPNESSDSRMVKSESDETEIKSEIVSDNDKENLQLQHTKMLLKQPAEATAEHPELFQTLTPPPPPVAGRGTKSRKAQTTNRFMAERSQDMTQTGIQITSVQTLAPLTSREVNSTMPSFVNERHTATLAQQGLIALDRKGMDSLIQQKIIRPHMMLQHSPVNSGQNLEGAMKVNTANHTAVVDLSKTGGVPHSYIQHSRHGELIPKLIPRVPDSNGHYHPENPEELLRHHRNMNENDPLVEYNPEEQQHHFLEIKRHLLSSKPNTVPRELVPNLYELPHSKLGIAKNPDASVDAHLSPTQNPSKVPSPLGKFSGAMMEHVKHWKEQNERNNLKVCSPEKISPHPLPEPQVYQRMARQPLPPHAVPMVPISLAPSHPPDLPPAGSKPEESTPQLPKGNVNSALLENLQAIHKMYFKTMQGAGEKVLFPKMPPNKTVIPMHSSAPEMVPMVRPAMPSPMRSPHMVSPRFPPEGQIPPELLNYHMNAMARNIPGPPPQLSPSGQKVPRQPMVPHGFVPEGHTMRFPDMNGRFPRPPFPIQQMPQHFQKHVNGNGEVVMVPVPPPGVHRLPLPQQMHLPGHPRMIPRETMKNDVPVSPQSVQRLLLPPRPRFFTEKPVTEPVEIQHAIEAASAFAKRKAAEGGAPLDLSVSASKIRRISGNGNLHDGDQPIDLSVKAKSNTREEYTPPKPMEISSMDGKHILPGHHPGGMMPTRLMAVATSEQVISRDAPPRGIPTNYLLPANQFMGQPLTKEGYHNLQRAVSMGIRPAMSVHQQIPVSATPPHHKMPSLEAQHHLLPVQMPTPEQLEMMKLVSGNTGPVIPRAMVSPIKIPVSDVPPQLISRSLSSSPREVDSDPNIDLSLKRKRGRPRGSTNKRRYQHPASLPPPLQIVESSSPPVSVPSFSSQSSSSDTSDCQFCGYKASSRREVLQHVKSVHFAKFRRDSNKSCEALTPTSEYTVQMIGLPENRNLAAVPNRPQVKQEPSSHLQEDTGPQRPTVSPGNLSDSEGSQLVIDTSVGAHTRVKEEVHSPVDGRLPLPDGAVLLEAGAAEKPPLKITLRRVSSTGDSSTPAVFSPLPQSPPERKPKYICRTCGASYNYINGLREHESRHRVDLPHECAVCHLKYKTMGMLSRHQAQKNHQV